MIFRRSLVIVSILIVLAAAGAGLAQIGAKSAGTQSIEKSALVTRSFNFSGQSRETVEIEVISPGRLEVKAQWTGSAAKLALILNGPDRVQYYARQDGQSPLALSFDFNQSHLAKGKDWKVSVAFFGEGTARGKIEIHLPRPPEPAAPGKASAPGLSTSTAKTQREVSKAKPQTQPPAEKQAQQTGAAGQQQTPAGGEPAAAAGPASLTLLSPNGGEELISGHAYKVLWRSTGDPGPLTLSIVHHTTGWGSAPKGSQQKSQKIVVARDFPNTGELSWTATRTGGPPSKWKLELSGPNARDESDGPITIAPYIELVIGEITVRNPEKKQNWALRTLKAIATVGMSEVKETIDYVKDDKDEGSRLKRGTDIVVGFAVMQLGTRTINERVHTRITVLELPSRAPVEVMACESRLSGRDPHYICRQTFKTSGPLFKAGRYLLEVSVDPKRVIPEEPMFRDNNIKTIEFQLVEGDPSSNPMDKIR
ncbi:MAG: hypothetical protein FJY79_02250 [Candidatus Aminicenantes bacterium]|nr:hypothetical protein [Candidatus Aminicenantes bacterium]